MKTVNVEFYGTDYDNVFGFHCLGIIDHFDSLTWEMFGQRLSTFTLVAPVTPEQLSFLQPGNFVMRSDRNDVYIVQTVTISRTDAGLTAEVTGCDCLEILNRRIIKNQITTTSQVDNVIGRMLYENAIPHSGYTLEDHRSFGILFKYDNAGFNTERIRIQMRFDNLLDKIYELCSTYDLYVRAHYEGPLGDGLIAIEIYGPTDKSSSVVFSDGMGNLSSWSVTKDYTQYKTRVYSAGEGEGTKRVVVSYGSGEGIDRYELYVDSSSISRTTDDGEMSLPDYQDALREAGYTELISEHSPVMEYSVETADQVYHYDGDYTIGDLVCVETMSGSVYAKVAGVTEIFDTNGYAVFPTFDIVGLNGYLSTEGLDHITTEDGYKISTG